VAFNALLGGGPGQYVQTTVISHADHLKNNLACCTVVEEALVELESLRQRLIECADVTLQTEGVTRRFTMIEEKSRQVWEVIQELEGVLCDTWDEAEASRWLAK
jgi:hypothetical protein